MLLYLPERIYDNVLKDDEVYAEKVENATKEIFVNDFVKSMINYDNDNEILQDLQNYIIEKSPEEYQMELKLCFDDDIEKYESEYNDMDIETKLYWLCEVNGGDMKFTKDFIKRNEEFIRLYKNTVKFEPEQYSNFIHMMYYAKETYQKIITYMDKKITIEDVMEYIGFEENLFNECLKITDDVRYSNMLYSKREQMYVLFFEFIGIECDNLDGTIEMIANHLYQGEFKYNTFTYFRLVFNLKAFIRYVDNGELSKALKHWAKTTAIINYGFQNKEYAIKSLNHYNNSFIDEFLGIAKFCYIIERTFMSQPYLHLDNYMTQLEKRFFKNKMDKNEEKLIYEYVDKDPFYSYKWANTKKPILGMIE